MTDSLYEPAAQTVLPDDLIAGIARRDPDAFGACYEALADPLFRYVRGLCGDGRLAEDMVEETFLELVQAAPLITGGLGGLRAWLYRAARNNLIDVKRKQARRGDVPLDMEQATLRPDLSPGPEASAVLGERHDILWTALAQVSEDQREVIMLRFVSGLSGPEVAEATGRTVGAVKSLQHRGLAALARLLGTDISLMEPP